MQGKLVEQDPNDESVEVLLEKIRAEKQKLFEEGKIKELVLPDGTVIDDDTKEDWRRRRNTLANLQLLEGRENESKNATPLVNWLKVTENSENAKYLPSDVSYELSNFEEFMEKRQELMSKALKDILL